MTELVLYEISGAVGMITMNRPEARNALTFEMYDRIAEICAAPSPDGGVKALIITGAGERAFAAGTDISLFRGFQRAEDALAYEDRIEKALTAIETSPVPTIAAISGACTGGGATIAVACDLRIATENSVFGFPVARTLGNCLSIANYARLVAMVGAGRVMEMVVTAKLLDAATAKAVGLVGELVPDHPALMARAREVAAMVAEHAPLTMRATKEALRRLREGRRDDEDLITECYMSEDFREGLEAFLAKRKPNWQGR
ncbi:MAG: enoyl-CoA hydratase/isomerase family protein [Rhodomicrobiaceae bacterium]